MDASSQKLSAVALCGSAAFVAALVSYQLSSGSFTQAHLTPLARPVRVIPSVGERNFRGSTVVVPAVVSTEYITDQRQSTQKSSIVSKITGSMGAVAVSLMAVSAVVANVFRRQQSAHATLLAEQLALAATSGVKERPVWFPGVQAPPHLTGQYPGDRGFDPVDFSAEATAFERMRASEVFHGRLAMLGAAGCLIPELLGKGVWFKVGETVDVAQLGLIGMLCMFPLEYWRGNGGFGWDQKEKQKGDRIYPGFDPMKMTNDDTKTKEIKNGRLAMIACLGLFSQAYITGASPLENLGLGSPSVAMFAAAGEKRPTWIPGGSGPAHLTGEFPADRGFDPLGLAKDPATFERMRAAEVFHCRLAMLGMVGAVLPELQGKGAWYEVTSAQWGPGPNGEVIGFTELSLIALLFIYPLEYWRGNGGFGWGEEAGDRVYPGFDPLGLTTFDTKVAEIKNGRLAMTGILGLAVQHLTTGGSPLENLAALSGGSTAMFAASGTKERPVWFPGAQAPPHLTGQYPGDRGFDPVDFSADPAAFERMRASEVFHGRLAMLGAAGCLIPELLGKGVWFKVGETVDVAQLGLIGMLCMFPLEYWRGNGGFGWDQKEKQKGDRIYPGFDPMKMTNDDTKTKEIKNGRLAMIACLGLFSQAYITGASPLENLGISL